MESKLELSSLPTFICPLIHASDSRKFAHFFAQVSPMHSKQNQFAHLPASGQVCAFTHLRNSVGLPLIYPIIYNTSYEYILVSASIYQSALSLVEIDFKYARRKQI